jgi:hypothetical protein
MPGPIRTEAGQQAVAVTKRLSPIAVLPDRWRYAESGRRDVRIDLLRGYAVFAMVCDHVAGLSWITPFTGANRFVVSAAEGFVFLAGLVIGMVFGRRIEREGWLAGAEAILRRATILYACTVGLTLLFVALFQFTELKLWLDRAYGLGLTDPVELVVGTLTLHYTYHGTDILWMYTILIAASPLIFLLLGLRHTLAILVGSWLLWLAYQVFPNQAAIPWVATNVNYFPVAAWQVIFVTALVMGYHRDRLRQSLGRVPLGLVLASSALGMASLILIQRAHDTGRLASWPLVGWLAGEQYLAMFDKPSLAIGRLLAFAVLAAFSYSLVTVFWVPIRRALGWLLLPLGTNSLRAYGVHLLLIVVVYNVDVLARLYDRSRTGNTILQIVTVGLTLAVILGWKRLEAGVDWRISLPAWPSRPIRRRALVGAASLFVLVLTLAGAAIAGPVRGSRQTDMTTATAEAGVLRFVPREAAADAPLTVLLALHGAGSTGPEFAQPLIDGARANGWALIAPTVPYGDWNDPGQVAADAAENLPRLKELIEGLEEHASAPLQPRILILGDGRGAYTGRLFALLYPELVSAVATVGPAPCSVPAEQLQGSPLPFPFGVDDLEQYVGEGFDYEAIRQTAFWIGVAIGEGGPTASCPWGALAGLEPTQRAETFVGLLARIGSRAETITATGPDARPRLREQALTFLRQNDPRARP